MVLCLETACCDPKIHRVKSYPQGNGSRR
jgi:hypothetical protein